MKLLYCPQCGDVRKLSYDKTFCKCGASWGYYEEDGLYAVVGGKTIPLGISNPTLCDALDNRPVSGMGARFEAFVIPQNVPTIRLAQEDITERLNKVYDKDYGLDEYPYGSELEQGRYDDDPSPYTGTYSEE